MHINNIFKERGFTIVELLIVIVVIGILAAITIVSYSGVQSRAKTTTNMSNAKEVQTKAETYAYDAGNGVYPSTSTLFETFTDASALSPAAKAALNGATPPSSTNPTYINYAACPTATAPTGAKIGYWDASLGTPGIVYLYAGTATSTSTCATPS